MISVAVGDEDIVGPNLIGTDVAGTSSLGNVGDSLWTSFERSPEFADGERDPMDRWSRRVLGTLAERFAGSALFPFDGPPWLPFQRWAARAEPLNASLSARVRF